MSAATMASADHPNSSNSNNHGTKHLELAIDFMTGFNGCFDPRHYHSFRGVSFLLPLRNCVGCHQRISTVVFGNNEVVQCIACGIFAHRSCAFSKHTHWDENCRVNYLKVHPAGKEELHQEEKAEKEILSEQKQDNSKQKEKLEEKTEEDLEAKQADTTENAKIDDVEEASSSKSRLSFFSFGRATAVESKKSPESPLVEDSPPVNSKEVVRESSLDSQGTEEIEFESQNEKNNNKNIFREPLEAPDQRKMPLFERPILRTTLSEDGVLDGSKSNNNNSNNRQGKVSKANFPFLSASSLLPPLSENKDEICRNGKVQMLPPSSSIKELWIQQSKSWAAPQSHMEGESTTNKLEKETVTQQREEDQPMAQSPESEEDEGGNSFQWTESGPPVHWATKESLDKMIHQTGVDDTKEENEETPLHFAHQTFASFAGALQENILAQFLPMVDRMRPKDRQNSTSDTGEVEKTPQTHSGEASEPRKETNDEYISRDSAASDSTPSESQMQGLLEEAKPSLDKARAQKCLGLATVAGGIAGGVAGLVFAGPVGGVIGVKFGQTAGILGVIAEGTVTLGVVTSGIAAGRYTGQQLQEKLEENRVLALGGKGTNRRLLLVRPSVTTDPEWADIYDEVRKSYSSSNNGFSFGLRQNEERIVRRERYEREMDIVTSGEEEIPTADKVLLLVSRILNNKESLPGHVYRHLIERLRQRTTLRASLGEIFQNSPEGDGQMNGDQHEVSETSNLRRARRQDAHAIIKYITAALMEVRPGFEASPSITELTATAVESLVFGEIYDLVIEEIEKEHEEDDNTLLEKIADFERRQMANEDGDSRNYQKIVSESAVEALHHLPEAHSAVDKLRFCVLFLEKISDFFTDSRVKESSVMGADSLLKMVCQHILVAKVFSMNAQIAFLEEFARDEQLLRGKEGYSLVTLQASLHFLNASQDFENDILGQDD